jgi:hypothetical protein
MENPQEPSVSNPVPEGTRVVNMQAATADAVAVLEKLVSALRTFHGVASKSEARAIIRQALMEL